MVNAILPLLHKAIPAILAAKGVSKLNPKLGKFISGAVAGGYTIDQAVDFLRDKFENPANRKEKERLATTSNLRPDEEASAADIKHSEMLPNIIQNLLSGGGAALGGAIASKGKKPPAPPQQEMPEHVPGLGQFQGEHEPGLGQYQGEHIPGLGQMQAEHGPFHPRTEALRARNAQKQGLAQQEQQRFEQQYGAQGQGGNADAQLMQMIAELQRALNG